MSLEDLRGSGFADSVSWMTCCHAVGVKTGRVKSSIGEADVPSGDLVRVERPVRQSFDIGQVDVAGGQHRATADSPMETCCPSCPRASVAIDEPPGTTGRVSNRQSSVAATAVTAANAAIDARLSGGGHGVLDDSTCAGATDAWLARKASLSRSRHRRAVAIALTQQRSVAVRRSNSDSRQFELSALPLIMNSFVAIRTRLAKFVVLGASKRRCATLLDLPIISARFRQMFGRSRFAGQQPRAHRSRAIRVRPRPCLRPSDLPADGLNQGSRCPAAVVS